MDILRIVFPIFAIVALGYLLRRKGLLGEQGVHVLNSFVYYVSLPALIIVSFLGISWSGSGLGRLVGFNLLALLGFALFLAVVLQFLRTDRKTKAGLLLTALVGNTIYMGFPLVGSAVRQDEFAAVVAAGTIHLAVGIALSILAVEFYVLRSRNFKTYLLDFLRHPLIISMAAGFALSFVKLPEISGALQKTLLMLGSTASPVALLALGGFLHGKFMRRHIQQVWLAVLLKLVLFPLLLFIASFIFVLPARQAGVSALLAGMPTAVTAFVVAEKYRLDESFVASCIVITTVVSLFTISIFLFLFPR